MGRLGVPGGPSITPLCLPGSTPGSRHRASSGTEGKDGIFGSCRARTGGTEAMTPEDGQKNHKIQGKPAENLEPFRPVKLCPDPCPLRGGG